MFLSTKITLTQIVYGRGEFIFKSISQQICILTIISLMFSVKLAKRAERREVAEKALAKAEEAGKLN